MNRVKKSENSIPAILMGYYLGTRHPIYWHKILKISLSQISILSGLNERL